MPAAPGAEETQAASNAQPQEGATQTGQEPSAEPTTSLDTASLQRELAEVRKEAAKYRAEAKRTADAQKAAEEAALPERDRLERLRSEVERERETVTRERRQLQLERAVIKIAPSLGFIDHEDALAYLDAADIEWTEEGQPRGLERALRGILERKPHLLNPNRTATVTRGVQPSGRIAGGDMNTLIRQAAGRGT